MELNLKNTEEQIFFDRELQKQLPEFRQLFDQWRINKQFPNIGNSKQYVLDFLNSLNADHITILEKYFSDSIIFSKIDNHLVQHVESNLEINHSDLCKYSDYKEFCLFRDKDTIKVSFWR